MGVCKNKQFFIMVVCMVVILLQQSAITAADSDEPTIITAARHLINRGNFPKAITILEKSLQTLSDPNDIKTANYCLLECYSGNQDLVKFNLLAESLLNKYPQDKDLYSMLAWGYHVLRKYPEAISAAKKMLEMLSDPKDIKVVEHAILENYGLNKDWDSYSSYAESLLSKYSQDADMCYKIGMCSFVLGKYPEAIATAKKSLKILSSDPNSIKSLSMPSVILLFDSYYCSHDWANCLAVADTASKDYPELVKAWEAHRGICNYYLGRYKEAKDLLEHSISAKINEPGSARENDAYYHLGLCHLYTGDSDSAKSISERLMKDSPDCRGGYYLMSEYLYKQGKKDEAFALLDKLCAEHPDWAPDIKERKETLAANSR